ncbi:hypothetical protein [Carboxylicivirga sp. M1479]|uniref:hypothetical protein n=1 Tax=Carboxylicivirga sp. M1479 TaxID=2594476 RepID=UPI0011781D39|nr:hypothetical protein [Carboxylicivirga sp. M1479]TRX70452.1 hypothetical protein FNN09_10760 [Carboxylicivirga sp. M1479]
MGILRNIKSEHEIYENQSLECLVAIDREVCKQVKAYRKKYKGKTPQPSETVEGYKFVMDEEFDSLKIDFSQKFQFEIKDLINVKG